MKFLNLQAKDLSWKTLRTRLTGDKKRALAVLLCAAALVLIALSGKTAGRTEQVQDVPQTQMYAEEMETRLSALLSSIDGAGKTKVLITLRNGTETVYARNDRMECEQTPDGTRTESEQEYILLGSGNTQTGLQLKTVAPQVQGVAVVCEGAGDPQVRQSITETVTAALGIGAAHVSVVKMKTERN